MKEDEAMRQKESSADVSVTSGIAGMGKTLMVCNEWRHKAAPEVAASGNKTTRVSCWLSENVSL